MLKLKENSLEWALKMVNKYNDTYIFPRPFELNAINEFWPEVKDYLRNINIYSEGIRPYRTSVTPKSKLGFRLSTQLDPLDSIITNAVVYEIHQEIEKARIPKEKKIVFSYRLKPESDGTLYDKAFNWDAFQKEAELYAISGDYEYVILTDIADFFSSIYLHSIETSLRECVNSSGKSAHAEVLINLIKAMHLHQTHKGIPIGPYFARPIAELVLDDMDRILMDNDFKFIRFMDDYRIFCKSEEEAYNKLAFLAQKFYEMLNLKLNEQKTKILDITSFKKRFLLTPREKEKDSAIDNFYEFLDELGITPSDYDEEIDIDSLDEEDKEKLEKINLVYLLEEELKNEIIDSGFVNFLLNNLARIDNTEVAKLILTEENIRKLFPLIKSIVNYLEKIRSFNESQKHSIGAQVIDLLLNSFVGQLEFNRMWIFSLFTKNEEWDNQDKFVELLRKYPDNSSTRKIYLALGRSKNIRYFRHEKYMTLNIDPWVRRAFISSISCLPEDERKPWYKARALTNRDFLDKIVEKWAEKNHF